MRQKKFYQITHIIWAISSKLSKFYQIRPGIGSGVAVLDAALTYLLSCKLISEKCKTVKVSVVDP
jgi:hypothetical protein